MAFRRSRRGDRAESVEIVALDSGIVVQGSTTAVTRFVDRATEVTRESSGRARRILAEGLAVAESIQAFEATHREYFEFSPRARQLLIDNGVIPTDDGWFRSFVRSGDRIAGNLDWKPVDLGPEQALAMQTAAVHLALRAAIKDVVAAIERVEGKVDKLVSLTRAERLGSVVGDRLTLTALVDRTRTDGRISATDWSTVDSLGSQMARDIESLRAYTLSEVADTDRRPWSKRSGELEDLTDELLKESLGLLVVAEQNYALWQELRLAHVASHEPDALLSSIEDAHSQLDALGRADQELVDTLTAAAQNLLDPTGYEGFVPLERRRLRKRGEEAQQLVDWFADQRHLDSEPLAADYPSLRESSAQAGQVVRGGVNTARTAIGDGLGRLRRSESPDQPDAKR